MPLSSDLPLSSPDPDPEAMVGAVVAAVVVVVLGADVARLVGLNVG